MPQFFEVPGDGCGNDGDGKVDVVETCDAEAGDGAEAFARGIGICAKASEASEAAAKAMAAVVPGAVLREIGVVPAPDGAEKAKQTSARSLGSFAGLLKGKKR